MKSPYSRALQGVTLLELMIVLAIVGILVGIAAPNYSTTIARINVAAETKRMVGILKQARNEARTRGATVTVSRDALSDWTGDVLVYESMVIAGNAAYNPPPLSSPTGDDLISEFDASSDRITVRDDADSNGRFISFGMQGWLSSSETQNILIAVCSSALPDQSGRYIEVNRVGKIRERSIDDDARGCL